MMKELIETVMRNLCLVTILTVIGIHGDPKPIVYILITIVGFIWMLTPMYSILVKYIKLLFDNGEN